MKRETTPLEAVQDRVRITDDGCWEWQLVKNWHGYGRWNYKGKNGSAHRIVYELLVGPIPAKAELDHTCRNRACVNPNHLEPVSHAENCARGEYRTKTHCKNGHPFDETNTYVNPRGHRQCRECRREGLRQLAPPPLDRSQCKNGHPRTDEHGRYARGAWQCKTCARMRARKPGGYLDPARERGSHCPQGHEYTPENTYSYSRDGGVYRYCRECNRAAARKRAARA